MVNLLQRDFVISIVTYSPDIPLLAETLKSLASAIQYAKDCGFLQNSAVFLVDNGPGNGSCSKLQALVDQLDFNEASLGLSIISGHGNIGFGLGHNLAINQLSSRFHFILNPDVILDSRAISECYKFLEAHPEVTCVSPYSEDIDGEQQFLCKRYPAVIDLVLRGFAPHCVKRFFQKRLARYEMRSECGDKPFFDVPIVSGCFMFFRSDSLKALGFSPRYFLYFEDFDLSLRAGKVGRLAYVPSVKIIHFGGHSARKGWRHILMFARSSITFFQTHGWKLW